MCVYHYGSPKSENSYRNAMSILSAHGSLHSIKTSSLPLAQFWGPKGLATRLARIKFLKIAGAKDGEKYFEYPTPVLRGKGKASMTDLMILTEAYRIAVEAKYTEYEDGDYQAISSWNAENAGNKWAVVDGWLQYMGLRRSEIADIGKVPYQLLHRIASAYAERSGQKAAVVYQLFYDFETDDSRLSKFVRIIEQGLESLSPKGLHFLVIKTYVETCPEDLGENNGDYFLKMDASGKERMVYGSLTKSDVMLELDFA